MGVVTLDTWQLVISLVTFVTPVSFCRPSPLFWFWSSFLVYCLSCQAPLHSINASTLMLFCSFNGVEIKTDQIKKSRCTYGKCNRLAPRDHYSSVPGLCFPPALCLGPLGNLNWSLLLRDLNKIPIFVHILEFLKTYKYFGQDWLIIIERWFFFW